MSAVPGATQECALVRGAGGVDATSNDLVEAKDAAFTLSDEAESWRRSSGRPAAVERCIARGATGGKDGWSLGNGSDPRWNWQATKF